MKLDREWVGFEDEDTIHDLEADRLTMLGRVGSPGSGGMTDPEDEDVWYTYTTQIDSEERASGSSACAKTQEVPD